MEGGVPLGLLILAILAGLLLLTPGGRSLLWGRWGTIEWKPQSRTQPRRSENTRLGRPFSYGGDFNRFS